MSKHPYSSPASTEKNPNRESQRTELTDEELLLKYEGGDPTAFEELFRRYRQPLFRFILRFLRDENASRDALQDLFLRVVRDPGRFQARSRFSTWLHAVARNLCIDLLRKRKHRRAVSLDQPNHPSRSGFSCPPLVEELKSEGTTPEQDASAGSLRLKLLVAIRSIPSEQRVIFLLREVSGMPFAEIAKVTGVPLNTAKSRMRYALINLRRVLRELGVDPKSC
jgi:RNA polymerase sigma-70 factor (ECF subfamily)